MYKQYMNDYEKRAEQIRKAARAVESGNTASTFTEMQPTNKTQDEVKNRKPIQGKKENETNSFFERFALDDILILALLLLLISSEEKDISLIIILGYLFFAGL